MQELIVSCKRSKLILLRWILLYFATWVSGLCFIDYVSLNSTKQRSEGSYGYYFFQWKWAFLRNYMILRCLNFTLMQFSRNQLQPAIRFDPIYSILPSKFYFSRFVVSKLLNRVRRGTVPCSRIHKQVRNIHQALENQKLVLEGTQQLGIDVHNVTAEDLWSGKVP